MHIYEKNGHKYPSVTTVMQIIGNEGITVWANSLGYKHISYFKELDKLAKFGTAAHSFVRALIDPRAPKPEPFECSYEEEQKLKNILLNFQDFQRDAHITPIVTEFEMVSDTLRVGGTCDCFGSFIIDGKKFDNVIIDFKTARKVHSHMIMQLSGYKMLLEEYGYHVEHGAIIQLNADAIRVTIVDLPTLNEYGEAFLKLIDFFYFWIKYNKIRERD